jgi:hypothetical protein
MAAVNQIVVLADIGEIIGAVMAVLVPLLWVIKQISEATKQGKPAEVAQPAAEPVAPRQAEPQAPRQAAGQQADPLRNQVEEFLRRAGRGPQGARVRPASRDIEVLLDDEPAASQPGALRPAAQLIRPAAAGAAAPSKPPALPRRVVAPRKRKSLAERATERAAARASKIAEQTAHLGQRIIEEDQQFDVQLKSKFDHTVGTLTGSAVTAAQQAAASVSAGETPAAQIAAMLATPDGVRQAIIVNEILRRPTDRW